MSKQFKIFMACDEANHVCDKTQYKEATLWEKIILNVHLAYCSACRKYTKKNTMLTKKIKQSGVKCLNEKSKEDMRRDFQKALKENSL